jgi:L-threonylcarbamoyladenylate synthase
MNAVDALRADLPVLLPADGVYGLCSATTEAAVRRLYALKGRAGTQPTAMIAASVEVVAGFLPEAVRELLPGPWTFVVPNPGRLYPWLTGDRPDTLGLRVPLLPEATQRVLDAVGLVAATSANEPGRPPAACVEDLPEQIREGCAAVVDVGALSGEPSTVIDLTGPGPVVLRRGAGDADDALRRLGAGLRWPLGPGEGD